MPEDTVEASRRLPDRGADRGDVIEGLSDEERVAIKELGSEPRRWQVPDEVALRLLRLGLAELLCGRLVLTGDGRRALAAVAD